MTLGESGGRHEDTLDALGKGTTQIEDCGAVRRMGGGRRRRSNMTSLKTRSLRFFVPIAAIGLALAGCAGNATDATPTPAST